MSTILERDDVTAMVALMADRIVTTLPAGEPWALVGIRRGGPPLADRLADACDARTGSRPLRGDVDVTLYRDDLYSGLEKPIVGDTAMPFEVDGLGIVLVDDVLFTGRTVRAAMGEVWDYGRPKWIKLAVLIDRGHRELPIAPDFVGARIATPRRSRVRVDWAADVVTVE